MKSGENQGQASRGALPVEPHGNSTLGTHFVPPAAGWSNTSKCRPPGTPIRVSAPRLHWRPVLCLTHALGEGTILNHTVRTNGSGTASHSYHLRQRLYPKRDRFRRRQPRAASPARLLRAPGGLTRPALFCTPPHTRPSLRARFLHSLSN